MTNLTDDTAMPNPRQHFGFSNGDPEEIDGLQITGRNGPGAPPPPPPDEDEDTSGSGPKPWPDPPRNQANAERINIYALIVGINKYRQDESDDTKPTNLRGCLKDVMMVEDYLLRKYHPAATEGLSFTAAENADGKRILEDKPVVSIGVGETLPVATNGRLHVCVLRDEQATYQNIIRTFQEHLSKATGEDTVFFHFSGHGSQQFTADEFVAFRTNEAGGSVPPLVPSGKDETLVCYQDSPTEPLFLADKELAKLIHEVENNPRTTADKKPHIVISLDCCHSGGGTRDTAETVEVTPRAYDLGPSLTRQADAELGHLPFNKRRLSDYYGGYTADNLDIPESRHVLLSAAEDVQKAYDTNIGGMYTVSLTQTLNRALEDDRDFHYADLFTQTRSFARRIQDEQGIAIPQNPQFDTLGGFDPYTCFLEGWSHPDAKPGRYEVFHKNGAWFVQAGAIHGLPSNVRGQIKVKIYSADTDTHLANGFVQHISAQHSSLVLFDNQPILEPNLNYVAAVITLPTKPMFIRVTGAPEVVAELTKTENWEPLALKNILVADDDPTAEPPKVEVEINTAGDFIIRDIQNNYPYVTHKSRIGMLEVNQVDLIQQTLTDLDQLAVLHRMLELENPNSQIANLFTIALEATDYASPKSTESFGPGDITIPISDRHQPQHESDNRLVDCNFRIKMNQVTQDMYFYAFRLKFNGAIEFFNDSEESGKVLLQANNPAQQADLLLRGRSAVIGLEKTDQKFTFRFKVFASTEELDYHRLVRLALQGSRPIESNSSQPERIPNDWAAFTFAVTLDKTAT